MRALAGAEIETEGDRLERDAATVLGYMLFEYSRMDMELGLFLVWSGDGHKLEELTKKLSDHNFHKRLEFLETLVQLKYVDNPLALEVYTSWLSDAHAIRSIRNQLFHGRWGVSPQQQLVANVVGLPTSHEQNETRYSIAGLRETLEAMRTLRSRLSELRKTWPV
jgi:hypothetical protein